MLINQGLGYRKPESGAVTTPSHHWEKELVYDLGRNTRTIIDHTHPHHQTVLNMADGEVALNPGEAWSDALILDMAELESDARAAWAELLSVCQGASAGKPSRFCSF